MFGTEKEYCGYQAFPCQILNTDWKLEKLAGMLTENGVLGMEKVRAFVCVCACDCVLQDFLRIDHDSLVSASVITALSVGLATVQSRLNSPPSTGDLRGDRG